MLVMACSQRQPCAPYKFSPPKQKKHEDKLKKKKKKMEEERETSGEATAAAIEIGSCKPGKSNKIHPGAGASALSLNYK
ncbi:hypothetical protein LOK49_LG04G01603 [Camellia lanceoleosa]|uniref:Uncharacterized protein n=1 Tax=Camellia lanceoleosa TaxID=1840588 RepID=A0ACC0HZM6_9ERIC|nr:hypothetical protein LOK49_LG04G01603 [Camellia lanceoleosa]